MRGLGACLLHALRLLCPWLQLQEWDDSLLWHAIYFMEWGFNYDFTNYKFKRKHRNSLSGNILI